VEANKAKSAPSTSFLLAEEQIDEDTPEVSPVVNDLPSPAPHAAVSAASWSPTLAKPVMEPEQKKHHSEQKKPVQEFFFSPPTALSPKRTLFTESSDSVVDGEARRMSCLSTPGTGSKKARVSFGSVELRKFRVSHGGSLSTPSHGAYPIGLSWEVAEEIKLPTIPEKSGNAPTNASPRRYDERARKLLLEKVDRRSLFEKQASWETEREELAQLRRSRQMVGCNCSNSNACGTSRCLCFKMELACNDDSCQCTCDTCLNPNRYNFDAEKVSSVRQARIKEAPYTQDNIENMECSLLSPVVLL
jgi:hypothetical protein